MWSRFCGHLSNSIFVPKGRRDSSLAVYCLEYVQERNRPVGNGLIGRKERYAILSGERASRTTHIVPYGTDRSLTAFQAINCLAAITWSLRDGKLVRRVYTYLTPHHTSPKTFEDEDGVRCDGS
jgi:hypothetical protein